MKSITQLFFLLYEALNGNQRCEIEITNLCKMLADCVTGHQNSTWKCDYDRCGDSLARVCLRIVFLSNMLSKVRMENNTKKHANMATPGGTVFASYCSILFKQCFRAAIHAGTFLCVYGDVAFISCQPWGSSEIVPVCVYLKCRVKTCLEGELRNSVASSLVLVCCHIHSSPWSFQVHFAVKPKDGGETVLDSIAEKSLRNEESKGSRMTEWKVT